MEMKHDFTPVQVRWIRKNVKWIMQDVCGPVVAGIFYILLTLFGVYLLVSWLAWMQGL